MIAKAKVFGLHVKRIEPIAAEAAPVIKPFKVCARLAEEFKLHLLEFTHAENKFTRCDFVSEGFADLCNAEGNFLSCCSLHICEVYENALCRFGAKINFVL